MSTFAGGPADGRSILHGRTPIFLRLVVDEKGKWDVLDQPEDTPRDGERVHVYRRTAPPVFACVRGRGGGCYTSAPYEWMPDVDGESLRETNAWRAWAQAQGDEIERGTDG